MAVVIVLVRLAQGFRIWHVYFAVGLVIMWVVVMVMLIVVVEIVMVEVLVMVFMLK